MAAMGKLEMSVTHELVEDFCRHAQHAASLTVDNIPPDHCPIATGWTQWLETAAEDCSTASSSLRELETAQSWEYFWDRFEVNSSTAQSSGQYLHIFKCGITPRPSDPRNEIGGFFKLQARSAADAETLCTFLAAKMVLELLPRMQDICGLSWITPSWVLAIWVAEQDEELLDKLRSWVTRCTSRWFSTVDFFSNGTEPHQLATPGRLPSESSSRSPQDRGVESRPQESEDFPDSRSPDSRVSEGMKAESSEVDDPMAHRRLRNSSNLGSHNALPTAVAAQEVPSNRLPKSSSRTLTKSKSSSMSLGSVMQNALNSNSNSSGGGGGSSGGGSGASAPAYTVHNCPHCAGAPKLIKTQCKFHIQTDGEGIAAPAEEQPSPAEDQSTFSASSAGISSASSAQGTTGAGGSSQQLLATAGQQRYALARTPSGQQIAGVLGAPPHTMPHVPGYSTQAASPKPHECLLGAPSNYAGPQVERQSSPRQQMPPSLSSVPHIQNSNAASSPHSPQVSQSPRSNSSWMGGPQPPPDAVHPVILASPGYPPPHPVHLSHMPRAPSGHVINSARQLSHSPSGPLLVQGPPPQLPRSGSNVGLAQSASQHQLQPDHHVPPQQLSYDAQMGRPQYTHPAAEHDLQQMAPMEPPYPNPSPGTQHAEPDEYFPSFTERNRKPRMQRGSSVPQFHPEQLPPPQHTPVGIPPPAPHPPHLVHNASAPQLFHNASSPQLFSHAGGLPPAPFRPAGAQPMPHNPAMLRNIPGHPPMPLRPQGGPPPLPRSGANVAQSISQHQLQPEHHVPPQQMSYDAQMRRPQYNHPVEHDLQQMAPMEAPYPNLYPGTQPAEPAS